MSDFSAEQELPPLPAQARQERTARVGYRKIGDVVSQLAMLGGLLASAALAGAMVYEGFEAAHDPHSGVKRIEECPVVAVTVGPSEHPDIYQMVRRVDGSQTTDMAEDYAIVVQKRGAVTHDDGSTTYQIPYCK